MNLYVLLAIEGLAFVLAFGGLSYVRREGLPLRLAFEVLSLTGITLLVGWITRVLPDPILFLAIIYLISMRCRILVDVATFFSNRGNQKLSLSLHEFALRLWPDATTRLVVLTNYAVVLLRAKLYKKAATTLEGVLAKASTVPFGIRYEAAARYNLGVTYRRLGREQASLAQFNKVIDLWPHSLWGTRARAALERRRRQAAEGNGQKSPEE